MSDELDKEVGQCFFGASVNRDDSSSSDDTIRLNAEGITIGSAELKNWSKWGEDQEHKSDTPPPQIWEELVSQKGE